MGIDYSFYLRVGYTLTESEVAAPFSRELVVKDDGSFHMEDRYDSKTGAKLNPVVVWDRKPKNYKEKWYEVDEEKLEAWEPEDIERFFEKKLPGCNVQCIYSFVGDENYFIFYPHEDEGPGLNKSRVSVYNCSMDFETVKNLEVPLKNLKDSLESFGYKVGKAKVFVASMIG